MSEQEQMQRRGIAVPNGGEDEKRPANEKDMLMVFLQHDHDTQMKAIIATLAGIMANGNKTSVVTVTHHHMPDGKVCPIGMNALTEKDLERTGYQLLLTLGLTCTDMEQQKKADEAIAKEKENHG